MDSSKRRATIERLLKLGLPPIPVAPYLDPRANEWAHHRGWIVNRYNPDKPKSVSMGGLKAVVSGEYCQISYTNVGSDKAPVKGDYCRLDEHLNPIPRFTGKNPSFIERRGRYRILSHGTFQKRMPTVEELQEWFCNPNTGIGTLGGHGGVDWIDIDRKNFESQEKCDRFFDELTNRLPGKTWTERTGSGGYRIAVRPSVIPTFTNFAKSEGGEHIGEALFEGRFTVLSPSVHPSGNRYQLLSDANPIEIESLEAIGIFPTKDEVASQERAVKRRERKGRGFAPQVSNERDNPWDIRNFARYFEGYHERGDGWGYAKCPRHHGTSQTSFRVNLNTGEFKLWCGCDTKDVWRSGLELAKSMGHEVPESDKGVGKAISEADWWERHGFERVTGAFGDWLGGRVANIVRPVRPTGFGQPTAKKHNPRTVKPPQNTNPQAVTAIVPYDPHYQLRTSWRYQIDPATGGRVWFVDLVPHCDDYNLSITKEELETLGNPALVTRPGESFEVMKIALREGYKWILNSNHTGCGKSHRVGERHDELAAAINSRDRKDRGNFGLHASGTNSNGVKVLYVADDHTNPTTGTIEENFTNVTPRHGGMVVDETRRTQLGNPHVRHPKPGEATKIEANCERPEAFKAAREKGYGVDENKVSPICRCCPKFVPETQSCPFLDNLRFERQQPRQRLHIDQISRQKGGDGGEEKVLAVVDEAEQGISTAKNRTISPAAVLQEIGKLEVYHDNLYSRIKPIVAPILTAIGEAQTTEGVYHGIPHHELMKQLPGRAVLDAEVFKKWDDIWDEEPEMARLWKVCTSLEEVSSYLAEAVRPDLEKLIVGCKTDAEIAQRIKDLPAGWIVDVLDVIIAEAEATRLYSPTRFGAVGKLHSQIVNRGKRMSFSIDKFGNLVITARDWRHANNLKSCDATILLDATTTKGDLAMKLGVKTSEILEIREVRPDYSNLTITLITGLGNCGRQRRSDSEFSAGKRIEKIKWGVAQKHPNRRVAFIDHKPVVDAGGIHDEYLSGYHFRDGRGTNRFEDTEVLVTLGAPVPNLGAKAAEWKALTCETVDLKAKSQPGRFWAWVKRGVVGETVQEGGRLRAHRRLNEQLKWGVLGNHDIEAIKVYFPGATMETVDAYEITPEAASKGAQTQRAIIERTWGLIQRGKTNPTINEIADATGKSIAAVTKSLKAGGVGGFKRLKAFLLLLYKGLNNKSKIPLEDLSDKERELVERYLPALIDGANPETEAVKLATTLQSFWKADPRAFERIYLASPYWVRAEIFASALVLLPMPVLEKIHQRIPIAC